MASTAYALGAGAGQGLDEIVQHMLEQAKLKQLTDSQNRTHDEATRHNTADEANERERIAATERERISRDKLTERNYQDQSDRAARDDGRAVAEQIPGGTILEPSDSVIRQLDRAGLSGSLLRGMRATNATPLDEPNVMGGSSTVSSDPDMAQFAGKEMPALSQIKLRTAAQSEKKVADERLAADAEERAHHNRAMEDKPPTPAISIIPTDGGYAGVDRRNLGAPAIPVRGAGGEQLQQPDPAQIRNRRDMATAVGSHFDDAVSDIDEADRRGLLGPLAGRTFTEFMAGKVGSTGNAADDELLGNLRTSLSMIRTGTASLHGRSGANVGIAHELERKMDEGHMSAAELKGSLKALRSWVDKYASKSGGGAATTLGSEKKPIRIGLDGKIIP